MSLAEPQSTTCGRRIPRTWRSRLASWLREKASLLDGGATLTMHGCDEDIWLGTLGHAYQAMQCRAYEERHAQMLRAVGMLH